MGCLIVTSGERLRRLRRVYMVMVFGMFDV